MSDDLDALEEIAGCNSSQPNVGSRKPRKSTGAWKRFVARQAARLPKIKRAQSASLTVKRKREGK